MKPKKSKIIFVSIIVFFFLFIASSSIFAAERVLETEYPEIGEEKITKETTLPEYVRYVFKFSLIIAAVAGLAVLIYGGFRYLFSAGSPTAKSEAISWLSGGILGLILLLSSYLILITINPELIILEIPGLGEYQPAPLTTPSSPAVEKTTFQEIPIGTLVENLLAKNIDCYDYDDEGNMTAPPEGCGCAPGSSGVQGGVEMMENWDRLDCIKRLAEAVRIKVEKLKELAEDLKALIDNCDCGNCSCSSCSGDPCPNRTKINELREKIKELVIGKPDPNFLNIREGIKRLKKMKAELEKDLDYLREAEDLMKYKCQYETTLSLVKFFNLKEEKKNIDKEDFEDFDIRKYCIEFNCIEWKYPDEPNKKFCLKYELNDKGRLCMATTTQATGQTTTTKEYFVFDGDPASFYCLLEGEISAQSPLQTPEVKCVIDAVIENGFEIGQIPIGETVDYAQLYIEEIIRNLNIMIVNAQKAADAAYDEGSTDDLYDLPPQFKCENCQALEDDEGNCYCDGVCGPFDKVAARVAEIKNAYDKIVTANNNIAHLVDAEGKITLCNCPKIAVGFIGGEIEIPEQLNRWKIINAFTNSRNKLERCIIGYGHVLKPGMTRMTLLNCMIALDKMETKEEMIILPGFEYFAASSTLEYLSFQDLAPIDSDYCYPYNSVYFLTDEQKETCRKNKDSVKCEEIIKDLMHNFFCCEGVID